MVDLHIQLHHLVDIEWFHCATGCRAQCVADEVAHMMIFDYGWEGRECLALFRSFQILLDGCQTFPARTVEQVEQHLQGVQIKLARESGPLENAGEALADLLQEVRRVGDQHGPGSRARDDHQLGGLQQHKQVPLFHQVPRDDRAEHNYNSNNREHVYSPQTNRIESPCAAWVASRASSARPNNDSTVSPGRTIVPPMDKVNDSRSPHHGTEASETRRLSLSAQLRSPSAVGHATSAANRCSFQRPTRSSGRVPAESVWAAAYNTVFTTWQP